METVSAAALELSGKMQLVAETVRSVPEHFSITDPSVPKASVISRCKLSLCEGLYSDACKPDCAQAVYALGKSGAYTGFELDAK